MMADFARNSSGRKSNNCRKRKLNRKIKKSPFFPAKKTQNVQQQRISCGLSLFNKIFYFFPVTKAAPIIAAQQCAGVPSI